MTTYYVATTGNDSNSGLSLGLAFLTPQAGANAAQPGDTVLFADGTYPLSATFTGVRAGTAGAPITFKSIKWGGAKLLDAGIPTPFYVCDFDFNYTDIIGFEIIGGANTAIGVLSRGSFVRFINLICHDIANAPPATGAGLDFTQAGTNNSVIGCHVYNVGPGQGATPNNQLQGIYVSSPFSLVYNNIVCHGSGYGVHCWHNPANSIVMHNLSFNNQYGGILIGADGGATADHVYVANNIVRGNGFGNVANGGGLDETGVTGTSNQYVNNCVFGNNNTLNGTQIQLQNGLAATGTIASDPLMINYQGDGSGDYRLKNTSPCIDAGVSTNMPFSDYLGVSRPQGSLPDVGPYEYVPAQSNMRGGLSLIGA